MNSTLLKIKKFLKQMAGFLPSPLPVGATEFSAFIDDLVATYSMPTSLRDDIVFVVASTILRLRETGDYKSKWYFFRVIRSAAAKQVAGAAFQELKLRQQAAQQAALTASAEVTATPAVSEPPK